MEVPKFEPVKGTAVVAGKIRTVYMNLPKISFKKTGEEEATVYTAADVLADPEIVASLIKSKSTAIRVVFDPENDKPAPAASASPGTDGLAKLTQENAQLKAEIAGHLSTNANLKAANDQLKKQNDDHEAHVALLQEQITSLSARVEAAEKTANPAK